MGQIQTRKNKGERGEKEREERRGIKRREEEREKGRGIIWFALQEEEELRRERK